MLENGDLQPFENMPGSGELQRFENMKPLHKMKKRAFGVLSSFAFAITLLGSTIATLPAHAATLKTVNESAKWMSVNRTGKTVTLKVIAGDTGDNGGMNFDGYSRGAMNVEIPQGWTVRVSFQNHSSMMPHSAMIVPYSQRTQVSGLTVAFPGAATPTPTRGTSSGVTQSFRFKAGKTGLFALVCAMPGHSAGGMWDKLMVSSKLKVPAVLVTEQAQSTGNGW